MSANVIDDEIRKFTRHDLQFHYPEEFNALGTLNPDFDWLHDKHTNFRLGMMHPRNNNSNGFAQLVNPGGANDKPYFDIMATRYANDNFASQRDFWATRKDLVDKKMDKLQSIMSTNKLDGKNSKIIHSTENHMASKMNKTLIKTRPPSTASSSSISDISRGLLAAVNDSIQINDVQKNTTNQTTLEFALGVVERDKFYRRPNSKKHVREYFYGALPGSREPHRAAVGVAQLVASNPKNNLSTNLSKTNKNNNAKHSGTLLARSHSEGHLHRVNKLSANDNSLTPSEIIGFDPNKIPDVPKITDEERQVIRQHLINPTSPTNRKKHDSAAAADVPSSSPSWNSSGALGMIAQFHNPESYSLLPPAASSQEISYTLSRQSPQQPFALQENHRKDLKKLKTRNKGSQSASIFQRGDGGTGMFGKFLEGDGPSGAMCSPVHRTPLTSGVDGKNASLVDVRKGKNGFSFEGEIVFNPERSFSPEGKVAQQSDLMSALHFLRESRTPQVVKGSPLASAYYNVEKVPFANLIPAPILNGLVRTKSMRDKERFFKALQHVNEGGDPRDAVSVSSNNSNRKGKNKKNNSLNPVFEEVYDSVPDDNNQNQGRQLIPRSPSTSDRSEISAGTVWSCESCHRLFNCKCNPYTDQKSSSSVASSSYKMDRTTFVEKTSALINQSGKHSLVRAIDGVSNLVSKAALITKRISTSGQNRLASFRSLSPNSANALSFSAEKPTRSGLGECAEILNGVTHTLKSLNPNASHDEIINTNNQTWATLISAKKKEDTDNRIKDDLRFAKYMELSGAGDSGPILPKVCSNHRSKYHSKLLGKSDAKAIISQEPRNPNTVATHLLEFHPPPPIED